MQEWWHVFLEQACSGQRRLSQTWKHPLFVLARLTSPSRAGELPKELGRKFCPLNLKLHSGTGFGKSVTDAKFEPREVTFLRLIVSLSCPALLPAPTMPAPTSPSLTRSGPLRHLQPNFCLSTKYFPGGAELFPGDTSFSRVVLNFSIGDGTPICLNTQNNVPELLVEQQLSEHRSL